ncbi:MAG: hypothetical protein M3162_06365 [Thermoproteota archaeon]|nr:hypothetical protein [Thermoproteota archaeon]
MVRVYVRPKPFSHGNKTIYLKPLLVTTTNNEDLIIRLTENDHIHIESMDVLHPKHNKMLDNLIQEHFKDLPKIEQETLKRKEIEVS